MLSTRLLLALAGVTLGVLLPALAQQRLVDAPEPSHPARPRLLPDRLPDKPSQSPAFKIPIEPLGFSAPGAFYLGQRVTLASLDFLDEDRLLFTFRVPGLIKRDAADRATGDEEEHRVRAVILKLPSGMVEAEALWTVHDWARYLWMLNDGHFLVRDQRNLEEGDSSLELKPFLRFPGPLLWVATDPAQQFLVTISREPAVAGQKPNEAPRADSPHANDPDQPLGPGSLGLGPTSPDEAAKPVEEQKPASDPDLAVRILRRDTGEVILVTRARTAVHLPINTDGYIESLPARSDRWLLNLNYFSGGSASLGQIESTCSPLIDFVSQREILATSCGASGAGLLQAVGTDGRRLWEARPRRGLSGRGWSRLPTACGWRERR